MYAVVFLVLQGFSCANNLCIQNTLSQTQLCLHHLNMTRYQMPQIDETSKFIYHLNKNKVKAWSSIIVQPSLLITSTQNQIHSQLATFLMKELSRNGQLQEILISIDGHVLDGHHRWAAMEALGMEIRVMIIDMPIDQLLSFSNEFSSSHHT